MELFLFNHVSYTIGMQKRRENEGTEQEEERRREHERTVLSFA